MQRVDDRSEDYRAFVARGYDACGDAYNTDRATNAAAVLDTLIERLPAAAHVLDLGCGAGVPITRALAERCDLVVGADISRQQARRAHAAVPAASIVTADMSAWPFRGEIFDAIVSFYAIFHVPRELQQRVFADIFGSLRPGGYLLASVGRTDAGSYTEPDFFGVEMYWSHYGADAYRQMVVAAGFELLAEQMLPHGYIDAGHEAERHPLIFARKRGSYLRLSTIPDAHRRFSLCGATFSESNHRQGAAACSVGGCSSLSSHSGCSHTCAHILPTRFAPM